MKRGKVFLKYNFIFDYETLAFLRRYIYRELNYVSIKLSIIFVFSFAKGTAVSAVF